MKILQGLYRDYIGIIEEKMETVLGFIYLVSVWGYYGLAWDM